MWRPAQYVRSDVPAVLSIATPQRLESPRFKEVVHPAPGTWMHHLEVREPAAIDAEVREWLRAGVLKRGRLRIWSAPLQTLATPSLG